MEEYEKRFPDTKHKMNKNLAKKNGYCIQTRPRSLHFSFVTDLYIEYKNDLFQDNTEYTRSNSFPEIDYATENYIFKVIFFFLFFKFIIIETIKTRFRHLIWTDKNYLNWQIWTIWLI